MLTLPCRPRRSALPALAANLLPCPLLYPLPNSLPRLAWAATAAAGLLLAVPAAQAQYKWKDAQGQLHVSDMPPPRDVPERNILQRPSATPAARAAAAPRPAGASAPAVVRSAASAAPTPPTDPELARRKQQLAQQASQQAQADAQRQAAVRAENCQRARQQLALLQSGQRMMRLNAAGEQVVLDDAARQADTQRTEQVIRSDCR